MPEIRGSSTAVALIEQRKADLLGLWPGRIGKDRFLSFAIQAASNPQLAQCSNESKLSALFRAAQLGLMPDGRKFALVPRRIKGTMTCCPEIMYAGLLDLVRRSGQLTTAKADVVYQHEAEGGFFDYQEGTDPWVKHRPQRTPRVELKDDNIWYAYAWVQWTDGHREAIVLPRSDVDRARASSSADRYGSSPWTTHFKEMAMKTAVKRLCRLLPMPDEVQQALAEEDTIQAQVVQDAAPGATRVQVSSLDQLAAASVPEESAEPAPTEAYMEARVEADSEVVREIMGIPVTILGQWSELRAQPIGGEDKALAGLTPNQLIEAVVSGDTKIKARVDARLKQARDQYANGTIPNKRFQLLALCVEEAEIEGRF